MLLKTSIVLKIVVLVTLERSIQWMIKVLRAKKNKKMKDNKAEVETHLFVLLYA